MNEKARELWLGFICVSMAAVWVPRSSSAAMSSAVAKVVATERFSKAGVDGANNLWMWNAAENRVTRVSPRGEITRTRVPSGLYSVDADSKNGIAALSKGGDTLMTFDWAGNALFRVPLPDVAVDVAWVESSIVVAPQLAGVRAEVIDPASGKVIRTVGTIALVPRTVGARASHATLLRYDWRRRELVTFETFAGNVEVFSRDGTLLRTLHVDHPDAASLNGWMANFDAKARASSDIKTPIVFRYATMSIDAGGVILLGEEARQDQTVGVAMVHRDGSVSRSRVLSHGCASVRFVQWQDSWIFFRDPVLNVSPCTDVEAKPQY